MRWLKRGIWKAGIVIAGLLLFLVLMVWIPVSANAYEGTSGVAIAEPVQATPTVDATVTALQKEQLTQQVADSQHTFANLLWNNAVALLSILVVVVGGLIGYLRWQADQRAAIKLTDDNQQEVAMQAYLDKMSELLLDRDLSKPTVKDDVQKIARVRTLTVLRKLDSDRKRSVFLFLYEAGLINKDDRIIDLAGAYLMGINLVGIDLSGVDLHGVFLSGAKLSLANLTRADLHGAVLDYADLSDADLTLADLSRASLSGVKLEYARSLKDTNLYGAEGLTRDEIDARIAAGAIEKAPITVDTQTPSAAPAQVSVSSATTDGSDTASSQPSAEP